MCLSAKNEENGNRNLQNSHLNRSLFIVKMQLGNKTDSAFKGLVVDHSKSCLIKSKPLVIPNQFLLAVNTHISSPSDQNDSISFMDMDIRFLGSHTKNTQKVFDKALEVSNSSK